MNFTYVESESVAKIIVIGVGGGGGNAINNMIEAGLAGVKFIAANTDAQDLANSKANTKIQLGERLTEGLGAGADPNAGRDAALESADLIREALRDAHMVFIAAGLGGGTGTGAAPVIAEIAKDLGALTVAVVTRPFKFEGMKRSRQGEEGVKNMREKADTVITIPNDRLRGLAKKNTRLIDIFKMADEILHDSVKGITDLIMNPGLINLDFKDVKTVMSKKGMAIMGIGSASGENRAIEAAEKAISHPLLEDVSIAGAQKVLMNITCNSDLTMEETMEASERISSEIGDEEVEIIWGTAVDETIGDEMRVTVIATGIGEEKDVVAAPSRNIKGMKGIARGVVRDYTAADRKYEETLDLPTYYRLKQKRAEEKATREADAKKKKASRIKEIIDLDVPTFLRRKAD
ncbi:MAG: cell division protein FtsZ [Deltaproteobacteria bacterium]|nr:cell division protein FtsZ [Deltaproteobacteria bacterium]